jgi:hypothetical protein
LSAEGKPLFFEAVLFSRDPVWSLLREKEHVTLVLEFAIFRPLAIATGD